MVSDLDKLQGTWLLTSLETDGQKMPERSFGSASIVIKDSTFVSLGMGATYEGTLELDEKKRPKTFQLLFTVGHAAGTRNPGIYTLEGGKWTMCLATRGRRAPRAFATKPGTGLALQTFERDGAVRAKQKGTKTSATKGGNKDRATKGIEASEAKLRPEITGSGSPTPWEGEWAMVAAVFNGAAMAEDMVKWCQRITRGNVTAVVAGPQVMLKATFVLDDSKTPHEVDYVNLEGSNARKRQAGIFEWRAGELRVCMSAPGQPRPSDFSSKARDGRSFTTWRRLG